MTSDAIEEYEARKRLRRSRGRWRFFALLALVAVAALVASRLDAPVGAHVARFEVDGVIFDDERRTALLEEIAEDDKARALLLHINSPGGTVTGSEALYDSLREIAAKKPVVATMGEVAASGGYIAALGADRILARGSSITGSVGVIFQVPNAHELMDRLGLRMIEIKSGPLKAEPTPFKPVPDEVIAAERVLVEDSFDWFIGLVRERRGLGENALADIGLGGVYTGRMARDIGLIDALGDRDDALAWLEEAHGIDADTDIVDYVVREKEAGVLSLLSFVLPDLPVVSRFPRGLEGGLLAIYR